MTKDLFETGLRVIYRTLESALSAEGPRELAVNYSKRGNGPRETTFSVSAQGKTWQLLFTCEEIEDSSSSAGIDPIARSKVHALVDSVLTDRRTQHFDCYHVGNSSARAASRKAVSASVSFLLSKSNDYLSLPERIMSTVAWFTRAAAAFCVCAVAMSCSCLPVRVRVSKAFRQSGLKASSKSSDKGLFLCLWFLTAVSRHACACASGLPYSSRRSAWNLRLSS